MPRVRLDEGKRQLISIEEMREKLRVDRHHLDDELIEQPVYFEQVGERLVLAISQRDKAKMQLQLAESKADREIRDDLEADAVKNETKKPTEAKIKSLIAEDEDVIWYNAELKVKDQEVGAWSAMKEAWSQRNFILKDLVTLWVAGYYGNSSETRQGSKERVRERDLDTLRAARAARRSEED